MFLFCQSKITFYVLFKKNALHQRDILCYNDETRENMKPQALFLAFVFTAFFGASYAAPSCSRANLTRCLDSVCAINMSSNPSARCQYCGTTGAGTPPKNAMRSVSAGASAKYNISEKELKKAPTDPGERYAWATTQCIAKVSGCTPDDVSETYDKLIEQSCTAAGVSAQMKKLQSNIGKTKNKSTCESEITVCVTDAKRCTSDYRNCEENSDFDRYFSVCSAEVTGCDEHISEIRTGLIASRDGAIKNAGALLEKIVAMYQNTRENNFANIKSGCKNDDAFNECVQTVCANNMPNQCGDGFERTEKASAISLCEFHRVACDALD